MGGQAPCRSSQFDKLIKTAEEVFWWDSVCRLLFSAADVCRVPLIVFNIHWNQDCRRRSMTAAVWAPAKTNGEILIRTVRLLGTKRTSSGNNSTPCLFLGRWLVVVARWCSWLGYFIITEGRLWKVWWDCDSICLFCSLVGGVYAMLIWNNENRLFDISCFNWIRGFMFL
jgi:hypothetical protein